MSITQSQTEILFLILHLSIPFPMLNIVSLMIKKNVKGFSLINGLTHTFTVVYKKTGIKDNCCTHISKWSVK